MRKMRAFARDRWVFLRVCVCVCACVCASREVGFGNLGSETLLSRTFGKLSILRGRRAGRMQRFGRIALSREKSVRIRFSIADSTLAKRVQLFLLERNYFPKPRSHKLEREKIRVDFVEVNAKPRETRQFAFFHRDFFVHFSITRARFPPRSSRLVTRRNGRSDKRLQESCATIPTSGIQLRQNYGNARGGWLSNFFRMPRDKRNSSARSMCERAVFDFRSRNVSEFLFQVELEGGRKEEKGLILRAERKARKVFHTR